MSDQNEAPAVSPAPVVEPAAFVDPARRLKSVDLDYPLTYAGRRYDRIVLRRLSVSEVTEFGEKLKEMRQSDPDKVVPWPMYFDVDGNRIPDALLDQLDDDDSFALNEVVADFLPRRFRGSPTE